MWLIALCAVFLLVFLNLGKIQETLKSTKFMEIMSTKGSQNTGNTPTAPVAPAPKVENEPVRLPPSGTSEPGDVVSVRPERGTTHEDAKNPAGADEEPAASAPGKPAEKTPSTKTRVATLYFVRIDGDGVMARREVKRTVPLTDSPLTDAIGSLLMGPGEDELRKELITLIPQGTKLLSAQVRGTTAYLNFSEPFMYNSYGIEGYAGQLKQVVWTATSFPTVQDVQILVEGERRDYLGGEGVYIGRPLSRNSF